MGKLAKKQETVAQLKADLEKATVAFVVDYRGLSVSDLSALRKQLFTMDSRFTIAKNTLLDIAVKGTAYESLQQLSNGPTALLTSNGDQIAPLKAYLKFLKERKKEQPIRGGVLDAQFIGSKEVASLADLPSKEQLMANLVGGIASPLQGMVAALSGPQRALVSVLDQYGKTKQSA